MKSKHLFLFVVAGFAVIGITRTYFHSSQDHKADTLGHHDRVDALGHHDPADAIDPYDGHLFRVAGVTRITPKGREQVFLPGIRIPTALEGGEDNWHESVWVPVASPREIDPGELVLAVVVRPTHREVGWVVFESQRAVLLPRTEIAQLLVSRFGSITHAANLICWPGQER